MNGHVKSTISTEAWLRPVLELEARYDGPDRESYLNKVDTFVENVRREYGTEIELTEAYALAKEFEARFDTQYPK
jgi:hypothetical protein